ncbi:MAG: hypothetical protein VKP63_04575 [Cyanobacteriota bacterium]|nr:hypothetical protein [Cyanobacteriota bacterium]
MACPSCGSWAVKADRALAGRMVCARCGHVLGLGVAASVTTRGRRRRPALALPKRWRVWLGLTGLVGVSAVLAAQTPSTDRLGPLPQTLPQSPSALDDPAKERGFGM